MLQHTSLPVLFIYQLFIYIIRLFRRFLWAVRVEKEPGPDSVLNVSCCNVIAPQAAMSRATVAMVTTNCPGRSDNATW